MSDRDIPNDLADLTDADNDLLMDERHNMLLEERDRHIREHGHSVQCVFPVDDDGHYFWYSIGRSVVGKPEILVTGPLPAEVGGWMVNEVARLYDENPTRFTPGTTIEPDVLLSGFPVKVVAVDNPVEAEMFGATRWFGDDLAAIQIVWPDKEGNFPGDEGWDDRFKQPVFGKEES